MRNSTLQDSFSTISFSQTGSAIAAGSWGSMSDLNPTVNVFAAESGKLVGSFNTPGSVFDIAVVDAHNGIVVAAGGKSVHANTMGRGGNLFSLLFKSPSVVLSDSDFILDTLSPLPPSTSWTAGRNRRFEGVTVEQARRLLGTRLSPFPASQSLPALPDGAVPDSFDSAKQWPSCAFVSRAMRRRRRFGHVQLRHNDSIHSRPRPVRLMLGVRCQRGAAACCCAPKLYSVLFTALTPSLQVMSDRVCIASKGSQNVLLSPQDLVSWYSSSPI